MKVKAIYHQTEPDGKLVHVVDHDNGGFVVSSEKVGIAVQNFLNEATSLDMRTLHTHLLYAFKDRFQEEADAGNHPTLDNWRIDERS
jgi:hypothetical protein